jgi:hypothetical protein
VRSLIRQLLDSHEVGQFNNLTEQESLTETQARELATILNRFYSGVVEGSTTPPEIDQILGAWRDIEAGAREPPPNYEAPPGRFGTRAQSVPEAAVSFKEAIDPRSALRVTTVLIMKDRAGLVGTQGATGVIQQVLHASSGRVRLIGHSYGCRVMLTAMSASQDLPRKVESMLLLQPAVNRYCFAVLIPDLGVRGGFVAALDRLKRPVFSTFSQDDAPLRHLFQFAARRLKDLGELRAAAMEPSIYAALGGYGPAGMISQDYCESPIRDVGNPYPANGKFRVLGVDATGKITGHGDIKNRYVYWALLDQVMH